MRTVLAVDGGNSKTDVLAVSGSGEVLARARTAGFAPHGAGAAAALRELEPAVAQVLAEVGNPVDHVAAYLANVDLPVEEEEVHALVEAAGWGRTSTVANDTFAVLRAGCGEPRGVAVVCGAGINCAGLLPDGRQARFAALGTSTGDWGGGGGLAAEVLWWSTRAEDGRGRATLLAELTAAHFGRATALDVAQDVHLGRLDRERLHELVPVLFRAARAGDDVALDLLARQAAEIATMARVALGRLGLLDEPAPVVLGGGVLAAREPLLEDAVVRELKEVAPYATARVVSDPPVLGAALLGLDALVASGRLAAHELPAAEGRLRTAVSGRLPG
uniref:N-acetylglucosamine kinase n=1 Tax=Motilibacter rhizosphaerae TaxID=598652 RepID=UPI001E39A939|nr:BadF/BadG/BcrA/BcrD ATPase family protein [Motilibacter rhizosphaerae]